MSHRSQREIIQEQMQANRRIVGVARSAQTGRFEGQAPVNERIEQMKVNERVRLPSANKPPLKKKTSK